MSVITDVITWLTDHATVLSAIAVAIATGCIAWFTIKLSGAFSVQLRELKRSIDLARADFVSAHRPKLIVRHVSLGPGQQATDAVKVEYVIANVGGTTARVLELNTTMKLTPDLGRAPPYDPKFTQTIDTEIEPGKYLSLRTASDALNYAALRTASRDLAARFYVFGYARFKDDIGVSRQMAFCRQLDPKTDRFVPTHDQDYEYEG